MSNKLHPDEEFESGEIVGATSFWVWTIDGEYEFVKPTIEYPTAESIIRLLGEPGGSELTIALKWGYMFRLDDAEDWRFAELFDQALAGIYESACARHSHYKDAAEEDQLEDEKDNLIKEGQE